MDNNTEKKVGDGNIDPGNNDGNEIINLPNGEDEHKPESVPLPTFLEYKTKLKTANEELEKFRAEQQRLKEEKLKQDGKLEELLEEKETELEKLKSDYEPDALAYRSILKEEREAAKSVIGEQFTEEEIESMPLKTLRKLVKLAEKKPTPGTDGGGGSSPNQLTESQKAEAKKMGLSEEGYKKFLERRKQLKGE